MAYLALIRHGESTWNAKGVWTGLTDIGLSEKGINEARSIANSLRDIPIDIAFTSVLQRAKQTLIEIITILGKQTIETIENKALNERDYGDFTGKNKWDIEKSLGHEEFLQIRRGWDIPIPNGETLSDVYNRVVPYYQTTILPYLQAGKNVLIVAHGNSLRALVKYLENIPDDKIPNLEIATGELYLYNINTQGTIVSKETRKA